MQPPSLCGPINTMPILNLPSSTAGICSPPSAEVGSVPTGAAVAAGAAGPQADRISMIIIAATARRIGFFCIFFFSFLNEWDTQNGREIL